MKRIEFSIAEESALLTRLRKVGLLRWLPSALSYRVVLAVLIAWMPLLVLTAAQGLALGTKVKIPFLLDLVQYARFLVALPIALVAGEYINPRIEHALNAFLRTGIVSGGEVSRLEAAVSQAKALKNSAVAEVLILGFIYFYTYLGLQRDYPPDMSSWSQITLEVSSPHTLADRWFLWVSMPLLLFAWFRWVWWIGVWSYALLRISRLKLRIIATHPDGVGGLAFVNTAHRTFMILVFAISCILCASIGEEILFRDALLKGFEPELVAILVICLAITLGPLLVFTPPLIRTKLRYWGYYGPFAGRYVQDFDDKWILAKEQAPESSLGTPDIQSLADLRNSYEGISKMRTLLPSRGTVSLFVLAYVVPVLPLLSSVISLREVLSEVYKLLLK